MNERWLPLVGYERTHEISDAGRIRSFFTTPPSLIIIQFDREYPRVQLTAGVKYRKHHSLHRLVAETFVPNPENKPFVNHIDGDKSNPHARNLEWVTRHENMRHAIDTGLLEQLGEDNPAAKLNDHQVKRIRLMFNIGTNQKTIASLFRISIPSVGNVIHGRTWAHLPFYLPPPLPRQRLRR